MSKAGKSLNVQVPGDTPTSNPADNQRGEHGTGAALTLADAGLADEPKESAPRVFADMHSSEVDATTLKAPVLCRDGWVCPNPQPTQKA